MNTQEKIKEQVTTHPVVLYMKGTPSAPQCGFSAHAVKVLNACGVSDLFTVDEHRRGYCKTQAIKFAFADQIGYRFTKRALRSQQVKALRLFSRKHLGGMGDKMRMADVQHVL